MEAGPGAEMAANDMMIAKQDTQSDLTKSGRDLPSYCWEEINTHSEKASRWVVIDKLVYDVTAWSKRHPGGSVLLGHFAGQDATEPFQAFHRNSIETVRKYLKPLLIGRLAEGQGVPDSDVRQDFNKLRMTAEKMGLFKSSYLFFFVVLLHILALDIASYLVLLYFGNGWIPWTISVLMFATAQTQLGWYQHDAGHFSIFKSTKLNQAYHKFLFCVLKGTSAHWWNHMHYQHHSKPNVIGKDPDVRVDQLFVLGEVIPVETAKTQVKVTMPYNSQHMYFFVIGPPLLFPVYFQFMTFRHAITRRLYFEIALMAFFFVRTYMMYAPLLGGFLGYILWYEAFRVVESHWFTWVSQSNHIPMTIERDDPCGKSWLKSQLSATCNVERSVLNDWFTGHLNFQIEHHLFPQMPRHNLYKIAPLVKSLCEKHGVQYKVKSLSRAFTDIYSSLKKSGELWLHTYEEFHTS